MNKVNLFLSTLALVTVALASRASADALTQAPVTSVLVAGHEILADQNQMTAYTFDVDQPGVSKCYGGCATVWPPMLVQAGVSVTAPFTISKRTDGTLQLVYQNHPLYTYAEDAKPGDTTGDGSHGVWHIITLK